MVMLGTFPYRPQSRASAAGHRSIASQGCEKSEGLGRSLRRDRDEADVSGGGVQLRAPQASWALLSRQVSQDRLRNASR